LPGRRLHSLAQLCRVEPGLEPCVRDDDARRERHRPRHVDHGPRGAGHRYAVDLDDIALGQGSRVQVQARSASSA